MMQLETITKNWEALYQAQLHPIQTEAQYLEMLSFMRDLMRQYDVSTEPFQGLWRLAAQYVHHWEVAHDELAQSPIAGFELLRALAEAQDLTQEAFAAQLEVNQGHLSRILRGERLISKKLALRVERLFAVPADSLLLAATTP